MAGRLIRVVVAVYLVASLAVGVPAFAQAPQQNSSSAQGDTAQNASVPYTSFLFSRDYSKGKRSFPNIFAPYTSEYVPPPNLINSSNIYSMIHDGKLEISLQDAIGLALRNDLNIAFEEYVPWVDETNLLNAEGGGTPASGSVAQIGEVGGGTFDPVIDASTSITDSVESILNPLTSGAGTSGASITHTSQFDLSYTQELHSGTVFAVALDNTRGSSSPSEDIFNPSVTSTLAVQIEQPLLRGFGFLPNTQFILYAKNNDKIGQLQFEETAISEVTNVEIAYWNLVADREYVEVSKQSLADYQKLYDDVQKQLKIGSLAPSDVAYAQSFVAGTNQQLAGARAQELVQAATLLQYLTKDPSDTRLKGLDIVPTTPPEQQPQPPTISLDDAAKEAWANRPELQVDDLTLKNDSVAVRATRNALLPSLDVTGTYESVGLSGNAAGAFTANGTFSPDLVEPIVDSQGAQAVSSTTGLPIFIGVPNGIIGPTIPGGLSGAYSQIFHNDSPTYAGTLTLNLPLRNRSAQAAVAQAKLNDRQEIVARQQGKNSIFTAVNQALASLQLDAAQVNAAVEATHLYQETYDYAVKQFNLGLLGNATYFVANYASQLNSAKFNELESKAQYEIALANFNMAVGRTLTANNITIANNASHSIDFDASVPLIPGTVDGRLTGSDAF
ncbi:MAG: TolC family protein, partial [Candidatus Acidiferrales bacterium]